MKKFMIVAAALMLAGCTAVPRGVPVGDAPPRIAAPPPQPSKIKQAVLKGCGWVTTIETIAAIITASPFVPAAGAVAEAICTAVTTLPFADGPGDRLPRVNGVVVKGYFAK